MKILDDLREFTKGGGICKRIVTIIINPCFHAVCLYRLSHFFFLIHLTGISKIVWYINRMLFHIDIDYRARLAGGLVIVHGLGTVIGKDVISTGRLKVYQSVTIGGNQGKHTFNTKYGIELTQPLIEDNVTIFTNACVFGPVCVAGNSIIKAGSIITKDYLI